jgi:hypothetical protein
MIQQIQVEEEEVNGESRVEEECSREEHPESATQFLLSNPSQRIAPERDRLSRTRLGLH